MTTSVLYKVDVHTEVIDMVHFLHKYFDIDL